jgi:hypothetical protein
MKEMPNKEEQETTENKKISPVRAFVNALLYLLLSVAEMVVYQAVIMFKSALPATLVWAFLSLSGLYDMDWFVVWIGFSAVASMVEVLRK